MSFEEPSRVSRAEWLSAQARSNVILRLAAATATLAVPGLAVLAVMRADDSEETEPGRLLFVAVALFITFLPVVAVLLRVVSRSQAKREILVGTLIQQLSDAVEVADRQTAQREVQVHRQKFESQLANALDMAEGEPEVIDVIERSFEAVMASSPVELLLADNSHAHLTRMAISPTAGAPKCSVSSPDQCPAARRAQVQQFTDSEKLDACPKLRGRGPEPLSAVCVPVSIMGRTVGVIHSTARAEAQTPDDRLLDLATLAKLSGARLGLLRVMAETQLQASTDSLTGLLNRRSFEEQVVKTRRDAPAVALAIGDLDHFKKLNDTYGHETGDRALRLFSQVLVGALRAHDLVSRHGGEEFLIALPGCRSTTASNVLNSLRRRLEAAITVAGLPMFTVSFGVVDCQIDEPLASAVSRADVALFQAKRDGRDRVVVHDVAGLPMTLSVDELAPVVARTATDDRTPE